LGFESRQVASLPSSEIRKIFNAANAMTDVVHLEIGDPDFNTPEHIVEAAYRAALAGATHYTATAGTPEVKEAVATKFLRDNGIVCDPAAEVIVSVGAIGAVFAAVMAVTNPGDEIIVTDPNWPNYVSHIMLPGGRLVPLPLREENGFRASLDDIRAVTTDRTKALIINSPNNPTGSVLSAEELLEIGEFCVAKNILVISDEVYEKIIYGKKHFSLGSVPEFRESVVTVNSLSKTYAMTGWRLGFACGPKSVIGNMVKVQEAATSCVSAVVQKAAVAALNGPQEPVDRMVTAYARRRKFFVDGLNKVPGFSCLKPDGAFYAYPNIKAFGMPSFELAMALLKEAGVATVHGSGLGQFGEGYLRMSFATSDANLHEALRRIEGFARSRLG